MNPIWLVANRELKTRLFSKAAIISTLIFVVLIAGGLQVAAYFTSTFDDASTVGVTEDMAPVGELLIEPDQEDAGGIDVVTISDDEAEDALHQGDVEMVIQGTPQEPEVLFDGSPTIELLQAATGAAEQYLIYSEIDDETGAAIQQNLTALDIQVTDINPESADRDLDTVKIITPFSLISVF